jgi:hypothetical protein
MIKNDGNQYPGDQHERNLIKIQAEYNNGYKTYNYNTEYIKINISEHIFQEDDYLLPAAQI